MKELVGGLVSHGVRVGLARMGAIGCLAGFTDREEVGEESVTSGGGQAGEDGALKGDGDLGGGLECFTAFLGEHDRFRATVLCMFAAGDEAGLLHASYE